MSTNLTADFEMVHFEISDPLMITYKSLKYCGHY